MTPFEIFACAIMIYGVIRGLMNGLIKEACSTAGFLVGLYVSWHCYQHYGIEPMWAIVMCLLFPLGLGMLASFLSKGINNVIIIGKLNRLLGGVLGFIKSALLVYVVSELIKKYDEWKNLLQ